MLKRSRESEEKVSLKSLKRPWVNIDSLPVEIAQEPTPTTEPLFKQVPVNYDFSPALYRKFLNGAYF